MNDIKFCCVRSFPLLVRVIYEGESEVNSPSNEEKKCTIVIINIVIIKKASIQASKQHICCLQEISFKLYRWAGKRRSRAKDFLRTPSTSDNIRQQMTTSDNIWQHMTSSDNIWHHLTTWDNIWQHLQHQTTYCIIWHHLTTLTTHDIIWQHLTSSDSIRQHQTIYDIIWQHMTTSDNIWPSTKRYIWSDSTSLSIWMKCVWKNHSVRKTHQQSNSNQLLWYLYSFKRVAKDLPLEKIKIICLPNTIHAFPYRKCLSPKTVKSLLVV